MRTCALALILLWPGIAAAQDTGGFNAHGFVATPQDGDIRDGLLLYRPGALYQGEWSASGLLEYANRPLMLVTETSDGETTRTVALNHIAALHLTGSVSAHERLRFGASIPVIFTSSGFDGPQGANFGDIRVDTMFLASMPQEDGIGLGVSGWVDLPTGNADRFLGRGGLGGGFAGIGTYETEVWTFTSNLGIQFNPAVDIDGYKSNNLMLVGGGARYSLSESSSLGLEALLRAGLTSNDRAWTGSPAEAVLTFRHREPEGPHVIVGLAAPLSSGAGAAVWRAFLGGGFGRLGRITPRDRDGDGIPDKYDACPDEPETFNDYIDDDGCPDELAVLEVVATHRGEPVSDVALQLTGPTREEVTATLSDGPWSTEVIPETLWQIRGKRGTCLEGEVKKLVGTEKATATLELQLVPRATVRVKVLDAKGNPLEGATLDWASEEPECLPEPPSFVNGIARADLGVGTSGHTAVISAPGHRTVDVPFRVSAGEDKTLEVALQPTKLKVEKKRIVILDKIKFDTAKAKIRPESFELLNEIAEVIQRNPKAGRVQVEGHTDNVGGANYNLDLSQRRAESVRQYLIEQGVEPERLIAKGFGMDRPIDTNRTPAGRARNRRVVFALIDQDDDEIEEDATEE